MSPTPARAVPLPPQLHGYLAAPALAPVWAKVRARLERNGLNVTGTVVVELDDAGARALSGLRLPARTGTTKIALTALDDALRASMGARGLLAVLGELGGPLTDKRAATAARKAARLDLWLELDELLVLAGLAGANWVASWLAGVRAAGVLTRAGTEARPAIGHATAVLTVLHKTQPLGATDPVRSSAGGPAFELAELATRCCGGDAHALDDNKVAGTLVLRALASAYGLPIPATGVQRRSLWMTAGVAPDAVSGTVLLWGLRPPGPGPWATMMRSRADLGLVTHITMQEWRAAAADERWAAPGALVYACENPQVLQAAARAGVTGPLCCTSGNPAAVAVAILDKLVASGVDVRYHGDFDVDGVAIAGRLFARGVVPWRYGARDYDGAVDAAAGEGGLALSGAIGPTPWDDELRTAMDARGVAVHEEALLEVLLSDLSAAQPAI